MNADDELGLCFHVTRRTVENFIRLERPRRVGQLADCFGAGTGCGWCRPFLKRLFDAAQQPAGEGPVENPDALPSAAEYAQGRTKYVRSGGGTPPPGATPLEELA
jgi:NAD(P)H-nitrite reductase large subunit